MRLGPLVITSERRQDELIDAVEKRSERRAEVARAMLQPGEIERHIGEIATMPTEVAAASAAPSANVSEH